MLGTERIDGSLSLIVSADTIAACQTITVENPYQNASNALRENASRIALSTTAPAASIGLFMKAQDTAIKLTSANTYVVTYSVIGTNTPPTISITFTCDANSAKVSKSFVFVSGWNNQQVNIVF